MSINTKEHNGHFILSLTPSGTHLGLTSAQHSHAALLQAKERKTEKRHKPNQNHLLLLPQDRGSRKKMGCKRKPLNIADPPPIRATPPLHELK